MSWKRQNVYIGSGAYAPKYWKREFINFINMSLFCLMRRQRMIFSVVCAE
ncbi:MAG: hypothetical protein HYV04_20640 [Deltaproteobacteria bacterium]|nr:hypothetical protein [Deltaproteobacteria bacterium]